MSILYTQSFAAGTSVFCDPGFVEPLGTDPLYPEIRAAETIKVTVGAGPGGENVIETDLAGPPSPYAVSGIWASYQTWALNYFDITVKVKPLAAALAESGNYAIIFQLLAGPTSATPVFSLYYDVDTEQLELEDDGGSIIATLPLTAASISGAWQTFRFCGKNATDNGFGAADGYLTVSRNGTDIFTETGLYLVMGTGTTPVATGYRVGYFGMLGQVTGLSVADSACGVDEDLEDNADICCADGPATTVGAGGGQGAGATPVQTPTIGAVIGCVGGGLVPIEYDVAQSEVWWGN